ncbi:unnamed protein product [Aphanomyces euteiches]
MFSPRWSTEGSSWGVYVWTQEKDARLEEYVKECIRLSLESSEEVDLELERAVYAARFPLGVNWKELAMGLHCTPMDCVRRYAHLKTPQIPSSNETQVVHSPRLEELISSSLPTSPMMSPPPFALRSSNNPFKWDEDTVPEPSHSLEDIEIDELSQDLSNATTATDPLHLDASSLTQSALEDAFLDMTAQSMPRYVISSQWVFFMVLY